MKTVYKATFHRSSSKLLKELRSRRDLLSAKKIKEWQRKGRSLKILPYKAVTIILTTPDPYSEFLISAIKIGSKCGASSHGCICLFVRCINWTVASFSDQTWTAKYACEELSKDETCRTAGKTLGRALRRRRRGARKTA